MGLIVRERATPDTPQTNYSVLYPKSDGKWYFKDDAGVEHPLSDPLALGTEQAASNNTEFDFNDIPAWVKRITIMIAGLSGSGTSIFRLRLGTASGIETSDYASRVVIFSSGTTSTAGFDLAQFAPAATNTYEGTIILNLMNATTNTWAATWQFSRQDGAVGMGVGSKPLGGALDRVRITTVNGTDTFDAGSVNIMYE
jgi:hypothetical protein